MLSRLERRLRSIIYQVLKDYPALANITARQRVRMAQSILDAVVTENVTFIDITALVDRILDVVVTWQTSSQVILKYEYIEVSDDLADEIIEKVVESLTLAYLNNDPWMVTGYTDADGLDPYLEFSVGLPHGISDTNAFVSTWKTDAVGPSLTLSNQVRLPLHSDGVYDFVVNWGDGLENDIVTYDQEQVTHTYAAPGTYDITILGRCDGFGFTIASGDKAKLLDVRQWGTVRFHNYGAIFRGCTNLTHFTAYDSPELHGQTNLRGMFTHSAFNGNINNWNVESVVTMASMFAYNTSFNQPLDGWSLRALRDARNMFYNATAFDQDLTTWCIPQVKAEPDGFSVGSPLAPGHKPIWGSCP